MLTKTVSIISFIANANLLKMSIESSGRHCLSKLMSRGFTEAAALKNPDCKKMCKMNRKWSRIFPDDYKYLRTMLVTI